MTGKLANFFTKRTVVDQEDDKHKGIYEEMEAIDHLYLPKGYKPSKQ